jgi:hypothetical protein
MATDVRPTVREIQHEVRIDLPADTPRLTNVVGEKRKPIGLRLRYCLRPDLARVDITVEFRKGAQLWPPVDEMPDWLNKIIEDHRPTDVETPWENRGTGMGGWSIDPTDRAAGRVNPPHWV